MIASGTGLRHEDLAHQIFSVVTQFCLGLPRARRRPGDLKDLEFLALQLLDAHGTMIVGEIQRLLGVLPAQMSRIIRSLEGRDRPLIACRINPQDKRKIDVHLTSAGQKALHEYQSLRIHGIAHLLVGLNEQELENIGQVLEKIQTAGRARAGVS